MPNILVLKKRLLTFEIIFKNAEDAMMDGTLN